MGEPVLILAFVVIVIGGIGSIKGALVGAVLVGLIDTMGRFLLPRAFSVFMDPSEASLIGSAIASMLIYMFMALVLAFRPRGLFATANEGGAHDHEPRNDRQHLARAAAAGDPADRAAAQFALLRHAGHAHGDPGAGGRRPQSGAGLGGMVSFGHAAYFGVGGYVAGILAHHAFSGMPLDFGLFQLPGTNMMPVIWVVAIIMSGLLALFIGAISIRTSGVYFIMITLAFAQMTYYFANSWPAYGGEDGLSIFVRNQFPGVNTLRPLTFFFICYAILIAVLILFAVIRDSRFGAALQAARQNEVRVATVGIDAYRIRLVAFVISGMITGLAGALYADLNRFVSPPCCPGTCRASSSC
jgi:ABC-type branched-subunit amino acid transport system permease subunit